MSDIAKIGAELEAIRAAERNDWNPLAQLIAQGEPLSNEARAMIAAKLTGKFKAKRGKKSEFATDHRNQLLFLEFAALRASGECPSNDTAYATLASRDRSPDAVRKAVEAGRQAIGPTMRWALEADWKE